MLSDQEIHERLVAESRKLELERPMGTTVAAVMLVQDCAVVGVPDPDWGERVCAVVVPTAGAVANAYYQYNGVRQHKMPLQKPGKNGQRR